MIWTEEVNRVWESGTEGKTENTWNKDTIRDLRRKEKYIKGSNTDSPGQKQKVYQSERIKLS